MGDRVWFGLRREHDGSPRISGYDGTGSRWPAEYDVWTIVSIVHRICGLVRVCIELGCVRVADIVCSNQAYVWNTSDTVRNSQSTIQ